MYSSCPRYSQNFLSRLPLAGYEWDTAQLDRLRVSGFIEAYAVAADLIMQQHWQIEKATVLPGMLISTRFTNRILAGYV